MKDACVCCFATTFLPGWLGWEGLAKSGAVFCVRGGGWGWEEGRVECGAGDWSSLGDGVGGGAETVWKGSGSRGRACGGGAGLGRRWRRRGQCGALRGWQTRTRCAVHRTQERTFKKYSDEHYEMFGPGNVRTTFICSETLRKCSEIHPKCSDGTEETFGTNILKCSVRAFTPNIY